MSSLNTCQDAREGASCTAYDFVRINYVRQ